MFGHHHHGHHGHHNREERAIEREIRSEIREEQLHAAARNAAMHGNVAGAMVLERQAQMEHRHAERAGMAAEFHHGHGHHHGRHHSHEDIVIVVRTHKLVGMKNEC